MALGSGGGGGGGAGGSSYSGGGGGVGLLGQGANGSGGIGGSYGYSSGGGAGSGAEMILTQPALVAGGPVEITVQRPAIGIVLPKGTLGSL